MTVPAACALPCFCSGADADAVDRYGKTPFDLAQERGYTRLIEAMTMQVEKRREKAAAAAARRAAYHSAGH